MVAVFLLGKVLYRLRDIVLIMVVAGFIALLLNPFVVALQRWKIPRRGFAVTVVTLLGLMVFTVLAVAFGYPLVNGISHLAQHLPRYVSQAEHGKGWIGHLEIKYHVQAWVAKNTPKLVSFGQSLAKPALSLGKGAATLVITLFTILVLVILLLLEGPKMRSGVLGLMTPQRAERYSRIAHEINRSVTGYMLGNLTTSVIAGVVVFVTLAVAGGAVPLPVGAVGRAGRLPAHDRRRARGRQRAKISPEAVALQTFDAVAAAAVATRPSADVGRLIGRAVLKPPRIGSRLPGPGRGPGSSI